MRGADLTVLSPGNGHRASPAALWRGRAALSELVRRQLLLRYRPAGLGVLWALLTPLAAAGVLALVLGRWAGLPSDGIPYLPFVLAGMLAWLPFQRALGEAATAIASAGRLAARVPLPLLALPAAAVLAVVPDLVVSAGLLLAVGIWYGVPFAVQLAWAPLFLLQALAAAIGLACALAALDARWRDVRHALPPVAQVWFFASPVVWPAAAPPGGWAVLAAVNPAWGAVAGLRWAVLGGPAPDPGLLALSAGSALLLLILGPLVLRRIGDDLVDEL